MDFSQVFHARSEVLLKTHAADPIGQVTDIVVRDDQIIVVDHLQTNVKVFSEQGELLMTLGGPGDGPGEFRMPLYAAVFADGRIAVLDAPAMRLNIFDDSGEFVTGWLIDGYFPGGLSMIDDGARMVVSARTSIDGTADDIAPLHIYDLDGNREESFGHLPEILDPYEDMFSTLILTTVGTTVATATYGSNRVRLYGPHDRTGIIAVAGQGVYQAPSWPREELAPDRLQEWQNQQVWTSKLLPAGGNLLFVRFSRGWDRPHGYGLIDVEGQHVMSVTGGDYLIHAIDGDVAYGVGMDDQGDVYLRSFLIDLSSIPDRSRAAVAGVN